MLVSKSGGTPFGVTAAAGEGMARLLKFLEGESEARGFRLEGRVKPANGTPFWRAHDKIHKGRSVPAWRVFAGTTEPTTRDLLRGHWLTAFAYGIADDQFTRAQADFELYSNVRYEIPPDLGGGISDVDVLVRTADVLLCIECKSGKVLTTHRGGPSAAEKTARNAKRLDKVFDRMELELRREYQLTYPTDEPEEEVRATVDAHAQDVAVNVVRPENLRQTIQAIASGGARTGA